MGNAESTSLPKCLSRFLPKEQAVIDGIFNKLLGTEAGVMKKAKAVTLEMLKVYVEGTLPDSMTVRLYNGMRSVDPTGKAVPPSDSVSKEQLIVFLSDVLRGIAEEKGALILSMISVSQIGTVKGRQVTEFTEDLISSVLQVLKHRKLLKGWSLDQTRDSAEGIKLLATQLTCELRPAGEELPAGELLEADCDLGSIEDWVFQVSSVSTFLSLVVSQGLCIQLSEGGVGNLLPECRDVHWSKFLSILDLPSVMYLNSQLPVEVQHQWRLLFSTRLHGESFSRLCGQVVHKGPTILVIRDSQGHIFGGFASHSWETKPQFQGSNRCFLFSVKPYLSVYMCTGYNDHYMYLNHGQQTMPNGLGMGGQHNYFGLWVDSNFGKGHSKAKSRCTTYNSPQLSAKEDFSIDAMEVWALGEPPEDAPSKTKKSILNADPEAQALMEMTGKVCQSEGLWEPVEEEEEADK